MSWEGQQYGGYGQGHQAPAQGHQAPAQGHQAPGYNQHSGGQGQFGAQSFGTSAGQQTGYGGAPSYGGPPSGQGTGYGGAAPGQAYGGGSHGQSYGGPPASGYQSSPYGGGGVPPGVNPELWTWFQSVDSDRSGKITSTELQQALMNGNWSPFNPETCRLMIGMFDNDRSGTIDIHEFAALWKYIQDWKSCFDRFDSDRSGNIDANELSSAFQTFGYRLSPQFSQLVVRVFDRNRGGYSINFDDFIQACVMLKSLTDKFRVRDVNQTGQIRISYEEFLEMALDTTLNK